VQPMPVAARSIRRGCAVNRLLAGNVGSYFAGGMDVVSDVLLSLRRAECSSRAVLTIVVCPVSVIAKPCKWIGYDLESGLSATRARGDKTAIIMLKIPPYKIQLPGLPGCRDFNRYKILGPC